MDIPIELAALAALLNALAASLPAIANVLLNSAAPACNFLIPSIIIPNIVASPNLAISPNAAPIPFAAECPLAWYSAIVLEAFAKPSKTLPSTGMSPKISAKPPNTLAALSVLRTSFANF